MALHTFLVVEWPGTSLPFTAFTMACPGTTVDVITEPATDTPAGPVRPCLVYVRGAAKGQLDAFLATVGPLYSPYEVIERNDRRGVLLARMHVALANVFDPGVRAMMRFSQPGTRPWGHHEAGVTHVRARVPADKDPERLADEVREALAGAGVEAQVEVREIDSRDYSTWDAMVRQAIGMAT